jgi:hypothetical protein
VQQGGGLGGERGKLLGVGKTQPLVLKVRFLVGLQPGSLYLSCLVGEKIDSLRALPLVAAQLCQLLAHRSQLAHALGELLSLVLQAGVAVEQGEVLAFSQEGEMLALAVDIEKLSADLGDDGGSHGSAVDAGDRPARRADFAGQQKLIF